jgi:hypothetical protein
MLSPDARKLTLSFHLTVSVGWIGAVFAYLGLGITAVTTDDAELIRAMWSAMDAIGWYVIVPLAVTSLVTGLLMALGTNWGLFRHYWVVISFVLTVFAVAVLLLHMPTVSSTAEVAQSAEGRALEELGGDLEHPGIGLGILLVVQVLNLYKPRGLTRYGWHKQQTQRAGAT